MASAPSSPRILVISQVYVPDPASVGQHMADAAQELVTRGFSVRVLTSARGYSDPSQKFPARETLDGVEVVRLPFSSLGKSSIPIRLIGQCLFLAQVILRGLFVPRLAGILVSTSPPMSSAAALIIHFFRRVPIKYWVMDINPDQMVVLNKLQPNSFAVRMFDALNRLILDRAADVVVLDRFMADRLLAKRDIRDKMAILPPWPHAVHWETIEHADNPFRREHNPQDRFTIMYSGNHGYSIPIDTIVDAAIKMQDRHDLLFMFIGEGVNKRVVETAIERHKPPNIISLPYQPLETTKYSLSAADAHLVSVGNSVVGVIHPCKVYGAMALARPILLLGPTPSHVSDIIESEPIGWQIAHGDVEGAIATIEQIAATDKAELREMGNRAAEIIRDRFNPQDMIDTFCDVVCRGLTNDARSEPKQRHEPV